MITVTRLKDGITIAGHAGYAEPEKDIVCAGVSTLAQTLIQSVEELTTDKIEYDMQPGRVHIKFWSLSSETRALVSSFFIGVEQIAGAYPDNVKVIDQAFMSLKDMD
jgi:uncharacterized protein YsxB (DUF464 family)